MKQLYCNYCRTYRADDGRFKQLFHAVGNNGVPTPRRMCGSCQETRRRPRADLIAEAAALKATKKKGRK